MSERDRSVVLSDIHGHADKLREAVSWYGENMHYVINGDMIDRGPDTKETLNILSDIDASLLLGNHEWALLGALDDKDPSRQAAWQEVWSGYESGTLAAYGHDRSQPENLLRFRDILESVGHIALLRSAGLYYESADMMVVHAGLDSRQPWADQKAALEALDDARSASQFDSEPPQLFSHAYASDWKRPRDLGKTLVTGHHHKRGPARCRTYPAGDKMPERVQLASRLTAGDPLFAYESWSGEIIGF
jgi:hypothetical protein